MSAAEMEKIAGLPRTRWPKVPCGNGFPMERAGLLSKRCGYEENNDRPKRSTGCANQKKAAAYNLVKEDGPRERAFASTHVKQFFT